MAHLLGVGRLLLLLPLLLLLLLCSAASPLSPPTLLATDTRAGLQRHPSHPLRRVGLPLLMLLLLLLLLWRPV
jgi:hypothetical protein